MFIGCSLLIEVNLTNFYTKTVKNMKGLFSGCSLSILISTDISNFMTVEVTNTKNMFTRCLH